MMFTCHNKGCGKTTVDSLLDESIDKVICCECGNPIEEITSFTKRMMRGAGRVVKGKTKPAFVVQCPKCQRHGQPIMKDGIPICYECKNKLELTEQFVLKLQEFLD